MDFQRQDLTRELQGDGPQNAKILVLTDVPDWADVPAGKLFSGGTGRYLLDKFRECGVQRVQLRCEAVCERLPPGRKWWLLDELERSQWMSDCHARIAQLAPTVIVALGDIPLKLTTGLNSIDKWHMSVLESVDFGGRRCKVVPVLHPDRIMKQFKENPFLRMGIQKAVEESHSTKLSYIEREFVIQPSLVQFAEYVERLENAEWLTFDIETMNGQITCIGFSDSPKFALCVPTRPQDWQDNEFHAVWLLIARVLRSNAKKAAQNGIYDITYLSKYGVEVKNFAYDTMHVQKLLYPEFPKGLDMLARIYTREPYWKDEGKSWSLRQDIRQLYFYNCKDVACTFEIMQKQQMDLAMSGMDELYYGFVQKLSLIAIEMSWNGLPIDIGVRDKLAADIEQAYKTAEAEFHQHSEGVLGKRVNPRSPVQIKQLLKASGIRIPVKDGKETTDQAALMKIQARHPENRIVGPLLTLSDMGKQLSSYLRYQYGPDCVMRYTLDSCANETGRWAGYIDPFGNGMNPQTVPAHLRHQFKAPDGWEFVEVDLAQADARVVAWTAPEPTLIKFFTEGRDIHRFVASQPELFNKPEDAITKEERQLGKKVGHASNYGMQAGTLVESCFKEMGLVISESKARQMLMGYHRTFPGIQLWHRRVREEIGRTKTLRTVFGRRRQFFDRLSDKVYNEAYAYEPQSTVTDVISKLVLGLWENFPTIKLCLQVHDSVLFLVRTDEKASVLGWIDQMTWNPVLKMRGGDMQIPIETKSGQVWGQLK